MNKLITNILGTIIIGSILFYAAKELLNKTMETYISKHLLIARPIGKATVVQKGKAVWMLRVGSDYYLIEGVKK